MRVRRMYFPVVDPTPFAAVHTAHQLEELRYVVMRQGKSRPFSRFCMTWTPELSCRKSPATHMAQSERCSFTLEPIAYCATTEAYV